MPNATNNIKWRRLWTRLPVC